VTCDVRTFFTAIKVIVYWAITDLCPDEMSQRQDHWRDGQ